jgi:lipid II:glycine glycyltransferase (peptidoglycan interpeptide bridge formation enzyme)
MRIVTLSKEEFDDYAIKHEYGSYFQTSNYAILKAKLENYEIHYLGFKDNNELIGASMLVYKELFWGYKFAYAPRGLLIDYSNLSVCNEIANGLRKLLKKQKFIFIKLDPPIIYRKYDMEGNVEIDSESSKEILRSFKKNGFNHMGFNIYNENMLPRFYAYSKLDSNPQILFRSFTKERQDEITLDQKKAIIVSLDKENSIDNFLDITSSVYKGRTARYMKMLFRTFDSTDDATIFYTILDTKKYTENINKLYNDEVEVNNNLKGIIATADSKKYNMQLVINDKMASDKRLAELKTNLDNSLKLIRSSPNGDVIGATLAISSGKGVSIVANYIDPAYKNLNASPLTIYEIMKYYGKKGYSYIDLGSVPGEFDKTGKYYSVIRGKSGFNSSIIEYIGEFDLVINSFIYQFYKSKLRRGKIRLK